MLYRVYGNSMSPAYNHGDVVLVRRGAITSGAVVVARVQNRTIIKRVRDIANDRVYILGDNRSYSTDSRHYGAIRSASVCGVVYVRVANVQSTIHALLGR